MSDDKDDHGRGNAKAWLGTIHEGIAALRALEGEGDETVTFCGETFEDADDLRERLQEGPLSLLVRGDWYSPGSPDDDKAPAEYELLLTTGGPALRIRGELSAHGEPETAALQFQDWGTRWTDYPLVDADDGVLSQYVGLFCYGEG